MDLVRGGINDSESFGMGVTYYHRQPLHQPYFVNQVELQFDQFYLMPLLLLLLWPFLLVI